MPQLSATIGEALEGPITLDELQRAIRATKPGKTPGPDSFTIQYYKTLLPSIGHLMVKPMHWGREHLSPRKPYKPTSR